jgi:hypothetical protein
MQIQKANAEHGTDLVLPPLRVFVTLRLCENHQLAAKLGFAISISHGEAVARKTVSWFIDRDRKIACRLGA